METKGTSPRLYARPDRGGWPDKMIKDGESQMESDGSQIVLKKALFEVCQFFIQNDSLP